MDYFVWYDENAHKTSAEKIHEAVAAYRVRFGRAPKLVLTHSADQTQLEDSLVRAEQTVQPNTFWLGIERTPAAAGPALGAAHPRAASEQEGGAA